MPVDYFPFYKEFYPLLFFSPRGKDNVIPIHTCVRHSDHIVLIMPYFPHDRFVVSVGMALACQSSY